MWLETYTALFYSQLTTLMQTQLDLGFSVVQEMQVEDVVFSCSV